MNPEALLDQHHLKKTFHRIALLKYLDHASGFVSADDIQTHFTSLGQKTPLSTIYRILDQFSAQSLVTELHLDHARVKLYELTHDHHTHHLICTECHTVIHIKGCPLGTYEASLQAAHHFDVSHHSLNFYGVCEPCQKALS